MSQTAETYDQEQAKLRAEWGEGDDDINVTPPTNTHTEVNPEIFKDVRSLLVRGFLHVTAEINDIPFVFKSLNHHELELVLFQSVGTSRTAQRRHYNTFLSYGVLMIDGANILPEREQWIPQITTLFDGMSEGARQRVIYHMSEVNRRADRATMLTEVYTMEVQSRLRWAQVKGLDLTGTASTGMRGTEQLGMNWGQLAWRALNYYEDLKEVAEREWENAKFVASSMAGKGMSKIHAQDRRRREDEQNDRIDRRDKIIRAAFFGEDMDAVDPNAPVQVVARTVEELSDQLNKDLRGEKDWHDSVVEAHEERVKNSFQARQERIQELHKRHEERFGERSLVGSTDLHGLSPQEVQFRLDRRRQIAAQRLAAPMIPTEMDTPKMAAFARKWGHDELPTSDRDPSEVAPVVVADRPRGIPFKRGDE